MANFKMRGNDLYDSHSNKIASIRGSDVYDSHSNKIGNLSDVKKAIDGAMGGISVAALWISFVR